MTRLPHGATVRRDAGLYGYERALRRAGLEMIAGVDEAGRGACAGPLVAGAAILKPGKSGEIPGLADSKLLTEKARERCYAHVVKRALAWSVVVIESDECDRLGMHVANVEALRRAVALLDVPPDYVLTDGFPVDGLGVPGLAVWKGDRVAACISAASVIAKVTRDRIMVDLDGEHPSYDFKTHKGYITDLHAAALDEHGPCPQHRMRFINVRRAAGLEVDPLDPSVEHPDPSAEDLDPTAETPDTSVDALDPSAEPLDPSVETPDPSVEPVETTDPDERVPTVVDLVDSTSLGSVTRRGETA